MDEYPAIYSRVENTTTSLGTTPAQPTNTTPGVFALDNKKVDKTFRKT
jgi:hypothetical protein